MRVSFASFIFFFSYFRVKKRRTCGLIWATPRHGKKKGREKNHLFFFSSDFSFSTIGILFNSMLFIQVDMTFIVALALLAFIGTTNAVCTATDNASASNEPGTLIQAGGNCGVARRSFGL
jgi:hypothetical protein